jgi:hypothetical protein
VGAGEVEETAMTHLTIREAAKAAKKGRYARAVAEAVIPDLIADGAIRGTLDGVGARVVDDEAFREAMRFGIERFMFNQQGWSFVAIDAPIHAVAEYLRGRSDVLHYESNTTIGPMKTGLWATSEGPRHYYLVKTAPSEWSVLIQTIHWISMADVATGVLLAAELSVAFHTTAIAAWDDDFSGSTAVVCEDGAKAGVVSHDGDKDWGRFHLLFYRRKIFLPECFIGGEEGEEPRLHARPTAAITRADRVVVEIAEQFRTDAPHVASKIAMMATATGAGLPDEAAFHRLIADRLWTKVQDVLRSRGS